MRNYEFIQKMLTPEELCNHQAKLLNCQTSDCGDHHEGCPYGYENGEVCPGCGYYAWLMEELDNKWFKHEIEVRSHVMSFKQWLLWNKWKMDEMDYESCVHCDIIVLESDTDETLMRCYPGQVKKYEADKAIIDAHPEITSFEEAESVKNEFIKKVMSSDLSKKEKMFKLAGKEYDDISQMLSWHLFLKRKGS